MTTNPTSLAEALAAFGLNPSRPPDEVGHGHIHRTWVIPEGPILQRINTGIFREPAALIENFIRVSRHLARPGLISTRDDRPGWNAPDGTHWRLMARLPGATRPDAPTPDVVFAAAEAYGRFVADLADLPDPPLRTTIPAFHDLPGRWRGLREAVDRDLAGRVVDVAGDLERLGRIVDRFAAEATPPPVRTVHNDAKLSNLLWVGNDVSAVIDLDTVMPGRLRNDFGDLLRAFATTAAEDERDLARVDVAADRLEAVIHGFLAGLGDLPTAAERADMAARAAEITTEQAVRFLADYLAGDRYYRVSAADQNLVRARNQIHLAERLIDRQAWIDERLRVG